MIQTLRRVKTQFPTPYSTLYLTEKQVGRLQVLVLQGWMKKEEINLVPSCLMKIKTTSGPTID